MVKSDECHGNVAEPLTVCHAFTYQGREGIEWVHWRAVRASVLLGFLRMVARRSSPSQRALASGDDAASTTAAKSATALLKHLRVRVEPATAPDVADLLAESSADLARHLPQDEIFTLAPDDLVDPNITFFVARLDAQAVGCVALVDMTRYGEIKRLFVRDIYRRQGVAQALMAEVEQFCCDVGLLQVKIETSPALRAAHKLYAASGYRSCAPFGGYSVLDSSLFMAKDLGRLN